MKKGLTNFYLLYAVWSKIIEYRETKDERSKNRKKERIIIFLKTSVMNKDINIEQMEFIIKKYLEKQDIST